MHDVVIAHLSSDGLSEISASSDAKLKVVEFDGEPLSEGIDREPLREYKADASG